MKPKILLTGKNGQVGYELTRLLPQMGKLVAVGREELDLLNPAKIRQTIRKVRPDVIVNAAAYTAVGQAEKDEAVARAVNADAPAVMAEEAKKIGAALVHYSTDYVFDGSKNAPYTEDDAPNPLNVYGKTKLAGDLAIQHSGVPHLILRTAWVYGIRGRNFLLTILRLATEREELRIVNDQTGAPTWCREIAQATMRILLQLLQKQSRMTAFSNVSGIYNLTAEGETTWFGFAEAILEQAAKTAPSTPWFVAATGGRAIIAKRIVPISAKEFSVATCRPAFSVLSNSRCQRTFGFALRDWKDQLVSAMHES